MSLYYIQYTSHVDPNKIYPPELNVIEGETATISCTSSTEVTWLFNSGPLPLIARKIDPKTIRLREVTNQSAGYYECEGTTESADTFFSEVEVTVIGKLVFGYECME